MKTIHLKRAVLTAAIGSLLSAPGHAGRPLWEYSAPTPARVTVSSGSTEAVHYTVTNFSSRSKNLKLKETAGLSASPCYLAMKGSTCTLTLTVNGSAVPAGGIHGGPMLCEQGNPSQCYHPSSGKELNIVKSGSPMTTISASPSLFGFLFGGTTQVVTLTNNGSVDAYNIQVLTPPGLGVGVTNNCPASLPYTAPNNTCQLTFTSGSTTGTTRAMIAGSNTNTLTEGISVDPELAPLAITGGDTMTLFSNDVHAVGWMVIKNNSATVTATNIAANLAPTALNGRIIQNASNCASVAPGATCTLRFIVAKTAAVAGATDIPATSFAISGNNTTQETGTLAISTISTAPPVGDPAPGGTVACTTPGLMTPTTLYLVAAVFESYAVWGSMGVQTGALDNIDGYSNTQTIVNTLGASMSYAANICSIWQVQSNGFSPCTTGGVCYEDWYLPSIDELGCLYNNQDAIGGFVDDFHWSSTESAFETTTQAMAKLFPDQGGGSSYSSDKDAVAHIRCVRAVTN